MPFFATKKQKRFKLHKRQFAATLAAQAVPALHVGALWTGYQGNNTQIKHDLKNAIMDKTIKECGMNGNKNMAGIILFNSHIK